MIRVYPCDPRECTLLLASTEGPEWRESCRSYCYDGVFLLYITPFESLKILRSRFDAQCLTDKDAEPRQAELHCHWSHRQEVLTQRF